MSPSQQPTLGSSVAYRAACCQCLRKSRYMAVPQVVSWVLPVHPPNPEPGRSGLLLSGCSPPGSRQLLSEQCQIPPPNGSPPYASRTQLCSSPDCVPPGTSRDQLSQQTHCPLTSCDAQERYLPGDGLGPTPPTPFNGPPRPPTGAANQVVRVDIAAMLDPGHTAGDPGMSSALGQPSSATSVQVDMQVEQVRTELYFPAVLVLVRFSGLWCVLVTGQSKRSRS